MVAGFQITGISYVAKEPLKNFARPKDVDVLCIIEGNAVGKGNKSKMERLECAVLLITYKRLDTLKEVFQRVREVKPYRLYLASDGAKEKKPEDTAKVAQVREWLDHAVDWPCEVYKRYSDYNQGCQAGPANAISWVFEKEEYAIILEEDIVAETDFFYFCQELLEYYKDDKRIMSITGHKQAHDIPIEGDYFFSNMDSIWGWATWKRAWTLFDVSMKKWPYYRDKGLINYIYRSRRAVSMEDEFNRVYEKKLDSWAYAWYYTRLINSGLEIFPKENLITNIGFEGEDATHTQGVKMDFPIGKMNFPLKKEENVICNWEYDDQYQKRNYQPKRIRRFLRKYIPRCILNRWYHFRGVRGY